MLIQIPNLNDATRLPFRYSRERNFKLDFTFTANRVGKLFNISRRFVASRRNERGTVSAGETE